MNKIIFLFLIFFIINNYHSTFQKIKKISKKPEIIKLKTNDPYSIQIEFIKEELYLNNINIAKNKKEKKITLKINKFYEKTKNISFYENGTIAEKKFIFFIESEFIFTNNIIYPIKINVENNFLNNPFTPLEKSLEKENIKKETYKKGAHELIKRLIILYNIIEKK